MLFDFDTTTKLGLLFISPYLQSEGSNYGHGSNFAASGFIAPISLCVQFNCSRSLSNKSWTQSVQMVTKEVFMAYLLEL
jgi:hypothetical protein